MELILGLGAKGQFQGFLKGKDGISFLRIYHVLFVHVTRRYETECIYYQQKTLQSSKISTLLLIFLTGG